MGKDISVDSIVNIEGVIKEEDIGVPLCQFSKDEIEFLKKWIDHLQKEKSVRLLITLSPKEGKLNNFTPIKVDLENPEIFNQKKDLSSLKDGFGEKVYKIQALTRLSTPEIENVTSLKEGTQVTIYLDLSLQVEQSLTKRQSSTGSTKNIEILSRIKVIIPKSKSAD